MRASSIGTILFSMDCRRFGRSRDGALGRMPRSAKSGDCICIFDGMPFTYAVPQRGGPGGKYALLGECLTSSLNTEENKKVPDIEWIMIVLE
jgi:hypothetical protein